MAFSVGEEELRGIDTKPLVGNRGPNYFESVDNPTNRAFVADYKAYAKAHKLPNADTVVTNDPMEATYVGIHMWAQAVEKAGTTDVDKVRAAMAGQSFKAPSGFTLTMDATNHHLHKPVMIGEIEGNGQFNVVWQTEQPVRAQPWSPFIAGNDKTRPADENRQQLSHHRREKRHERHAPVHRSCMAFRTAARDGAGIGCRSFCCRQPQPAGGFVDAVGRRAGCVKTAAPEALQRKISTSIRKSTPLHNAMATSSR